jgi:hypothetical protein
MGDSACAPPDDDGMPSTNASVEGAETRGSGVAASAGLSRRDFVRGGSTAVGVGAALVWSGPAIRTIRLAANAGSPMPPPTTETVFPEGSTIPENEPPVSEPSPSVPESETTAAKTSPPEAVGGENTLPFTGAAIATTAAAGAGAIVAGRALMSARRRPPER